MSEVIKNLDDIENKVMGELKDFQIATVERIDALYRQGQKRVLVSDEVGLGKTLVARGTIAKFAKLRHEEEDELVKVVYICSNTTIAEQNIEKLRIVHNINIENANTSRLSMQHLNIFMQEYDESILNNYIQIIPLTPQTSFKITNSQGTVNERALIYAILKRVPLLKDFREELEKIFRFNVKYWDDSRDYWDSQVTKCNQISNGEYIKYMVDELIKNSEDLQELIDLCQIIKKFGDKNVKIIPIIKKFRLLFADISLNKLNPDLIIMDEFQRFKYLLNSDEESDMNKLISKFFKLDDMRILMLSATPYKMYSTLDEIYEEDIDSHYSEFLEVIKFLTETKEGYENFEKIWHNYSIELKEFNKGKFSFIEAKKIAEKKLYENICRTERISENQLSDLIVDVKNTLTVSKKDTESYEEVQKLLDDIGLNISVPIDYIKSTPYIMSFMKNYQLKKKIEKYFSKNSIEISKMNKNTFWLNKSKIDNYEKISYNNARLDNLMTHVLKDNAEKLLWIPPSLPYYELKGAFNNIDNFSKTLIFSSWEMVPRMISSMISYEIERKTIGKLKDYNPNIRYFTKNRSLSARLRFNQMSVFTLIYPSIFLVDVYNPKDCLNRNLSLEEIEKEIKHKIKEKLDKLPKKDSEREDQRWYYLAPILLDTLEYGNSFGRWYSDIKKLMSEKYQKKVGFQNLLDKFYHIYIFYQRDLGRQPDDLVDVLCDMAIGSPSICAYRLFKNEFEDDSLIDLYNKYSSDIGRSFINFMNHPESIAVIDLTYKSNSNDSYWKNVLKYSKDGNLQAVFEEYVHLISSGLYNNNEEKLLKITNTLLSSFNLKTTNYDFDTFNNFKSKVLGNEYSPNTLRSHFAVAFTEGSNQNETDRKKAVRDAFNSPFRPFVLASTSIGQEGLDFHNYCRRIVHWNLPSNPIDLEQREGRINRFECLAIRQNIAKRYGNIHFKTNQIWDELFIEAYNNEKIGQCSDLIPYWGLNDSTDMIKIERVVPLYPFSRDVVKYERLIKLLSLYRLTLGQSRQEYILDNIFKNIDVGEKDYQELFINLSPYYNSDNKDFNKHYNFST